MNKRLRAIAVAVGAGVAAAGLLANPSNSAPLVCHEGPLGFSRCVVSLTASGPSPNVLTMRAESFAAFSNPDFVAHTVVFANGLCTLTLPPGEQGWSGVRDCPNRFSYYVGTYAYTVDGKFPGTVVTMPLPRSVSLTTRTHTMRGGTRLTLHGQVRRSYTNTAPPPPVVVLARHNSKEPFEPVATVRTRGAHRATYGWKLHVQPDVTTTYVARVTAQRLCYYPTSRCAHAQGQVWTNAESRPFTVRVRH